MTNQDAEIRSSIVLFVTGLVVAFVLVVMFFYFRQRLFTRTQPIVLSSGDRPQIQ